MASKGVNKCILIGNCGKDPEVKNFGNGGSICNISLATSESYNDRSGKETERTEWHNLVFRGGLVDVASRYLKKGSKIYVEGSIRTRKWQDKEGKDRYTTEIEVRDMQMLDGQGDRGAAPQDDGFGNTLRSSVARFPSRPAPAPAATPAAASGPSYGSFEDDDIPF